MLDTIIGFFILAGIYAAFCVTLIATYFIIFGVPIILIGLTAVGLVKLYKKLFK